MKKLTKEEASKIGIIKHGNYSAVSAHLLQLEIGEALIINKKTDWKSKSPPYRIVNYFTKKTGRKFEAGKTPDGKGWAVKRIS